MPSPRNKIVSLEATPYYHCIGRCVRRAFLWGTDAFSGQDFSHRKVWVVERLAELSRFFAIDICAYAVMSNHYHLVLHVDAERVKQWSDAEIAVRWGALFLLPPILLKYLSETQHDPAELPVVTALLNKLRQRLCDLSWFMRCLNEPLARRANLEDHCKGRFWEGRFKSQAILDEAGLLACCAYVDLNPLRTGVSQTPEESDFTSIQQRIYEFNADIHHKSMNDHTTNNRNIESNSVQTHHKSSFSLMQRLSPEINPELYPFSNFANSETNFTLPYAWSDYLELVDWTSRLIRTDHKLSLNPTFPSILNRLGFTSETFMLHMRHQAMHQGSALGSFKSMRDLAGILHKKFIKGIFMPPTQSTAGFAAI